VIMHISRREIQSKMTKEGVTEAIIACIPMLTKPEEGVVTLLNLLNNNKKNLRAFGQRAVCIAAATMLAKGKSMDIVLLGFCAKSLGCLIADASCNTTPEEGIKLRHALQQGFGNGGGIESLSLCLSALLQENVSSVIRQEVTCETETAVDVLRTLVEALFGHTQNQDRCARLGVIPTIMRLMEKHKDDAEIIQAGCWSLYNVGRSHKQNTRTIAAEGGMKYVTQAAEIYCNLGGQELSMADFSSEPVTLKWEVACVACGKTSSDVGGGKLAKCAACTVAPRYCSSECQRMCWRAHKAECQANKMQKT
jgi:hypothetical protein